MSVRSIEEKSQVLQSDWYRGLSKFAKPDFGKAVWQLVSTVSGS